jgi:raw score 3.54
MTTSEQINIAFAIDAKYTPHLETLIKSICYYNKNINFYVLHNDIPQEWFEGIRCKLEKMGNNLFSIYISDDIFKDYKTLEHISSSSSYYRLLIPKLINQDRVLYLDSDIIVNGSLSDFYYSDLNGAPVGVVKDYGIGEHFPFPYLDASVSRNYFNSGVLLIDCVKWRNEGLVDILLQIVEEYGDQVLYGDQCILNIVLREKAKYYSFNENAQVQYIEAIKQQYGTNQVKLDIPPTIIHYAAKHKPWDNQNIELFEREKYWFFRHLDWAYLILRPENTIN